VNEEELSRSLAARPIVRERDPDRIPVAFWAFHRQFGRAYRHYAQLQLGDARMAGRVVHLVFLSLLKGWTRLMEEANPAASAWAHLKEAVAEVLLVEGRESALPETAAFCRVRRAVLEDSRDEFAAMESSVGLYPAIARLPGQQFDVVVLRYVLDFTTAETARVLGVTDATVRSHRMHARQRLAQDLGIELGSRGDQD
jgi:DNA-directed RNA polymerase specialized sigma24 family protein